jgi:hypothetical protein
LTDAYRGRIRTEEKEHVAWQKLTPVLLPFPLHEKEPMKKWLQKRERKRFHTLFLYIYKKPEMAGSWKQRKEKDQLRFDLKSSEQTLVESFLASLASISVCCKALRRILCRSETLEATN